MIKNIHIFGGGTFAHVRNHFALAAPAFGTTAYRLGDLFRAALMDSRYNGQWDIELELTRMAATHSKMITNDDVAERVDELLAKRSTKVIIMNATLCDWKPRHLVYACDEGTGGSAKAEACIFGAHETRLSTDKAGLAGIHLDLGPAPKVLTRIRKDAVGRKDVFLVAFKTTAGATPQQQYLAGLALLKGASCNLVLANDTVTRLNMIIVPEEARYCETTDRNKVLAELVDMTLARANLSYTRSSVVGTEADLVPWNDPRIPANLREVVDYCIAKGAYKPFRGSTAGHFAVKLGENEFLTSRRKTNYNIDLKEKGLVRVEASDDNKKVIAYGAKPSVGGQSQRIIFKEHPGFDCIVHAHVPLRKDAQDLVNVRSQREFECGSTACGKNTSDGLMGHPQSGIKAVMLDNHGPNIVFKKDTDPKEVIRFIERNFDLSDKTGGLLT